MSTKAKVVDEKTESLVREKITDERLQKFALSESSRRRVVLLEVDIAPPKVRIRGSRVVGTRSVPRRTFASSGEDAKRALTKARKILRRLEELGADGRFLRSSGVVLAKLDAEQLRDAMVASDVRAVHPNRHYAS